MSDTYSKSGARVMHEYAMDKSRPGLLDYLAGMEAQIGQLHDRIINLQDRVHALESASPKKRTRK